MLANVHEAVLMCPDDQFAEVVEAAERLFESGGASWVYDPSAGGYGVRVFEPGLSGLSPKQWSVVEPLINGLDQLLIFAVENAPDDVVTEWADDHISGMGETALKRRDRVRDSCIQVAREWRTRAHSTGKVLGDIRTSVLLTLGPPDVQLNLRLDAYHSGGPPRRIPVPGSHQYFEVSLTRNDVKRIVNHLSKALFLFPETDLDDDSVETESDLDNEISGVEIAKDGGEANGEG